MTRLTRDMVNGITPSLAKLDEDLARSTGESLLGLAAQTIRSSADELGETFRKLSAAAIPISSGKGLIPGFAGAVSGILNHLGLRACTTDCPDVEGFGEAMTNGADILFAADDSRFLAMRPKTNSVVENRRATAVGFAQALAAAWRIRGQKCDEIDVLIVGLGPVGMYAVEYLLTFGARVAAFDTDPTRLAHCLKRFSEVTPVQNEDQAFQEFDYILDATPAPDIINGSMVCEDTVICCPGVPHGLTACARKKIGAGFIHDHLAVGVAVMAAQCTRKESVQLWGDGPMSGCSR